MPCSASAEQLETIVVFSMPASGTEGQPSEMPCTVAAHTFVVQLVQSGEPQPMQFSVLFPTVVPAEAVRRCASAR